MKNNLLYVLLIFSFYSCNKIRTYECKSNCGTMTVYGNVINLTDSTYNGVDNIPIWIEIKYMAHGSKKKFKKLAQTTSNSNGDFSMTIKVDSTEINSGEYRLEIKFNGNDNTNENFYLYSDSTTFLNNKYPINDSIGFFLKVNELTQVDFILKRTQSDIFKTMDMNFWRIEKKIKIDDYTIKYETTISDKFYSFKAIAKSYIYVDMIKHSGIYDTIPGTNGLGHYEINTVSKKDSIYCLPKVLNSLTFYY